MKNRTFKSCMLALIAGASLSALVGCDKPADVASQNLSTAADNFQIARRIVFYNGITGEYMLTIQGLCSLGNYDKKGELSVTCKTGPGQYVKDFLGLSDNVTYFAEQLNAADVSTHRYTVVFKPSVLLPEVNVQ